MTKPINGSSCGMNVNFVSTPWDKNPLFQAKEKEKTPKPQPQQQNQAQVEKKARVYTPINAPQAPAANNAPGTEGVFRIFKSMNNYVKMLLEKLQNPQSLVPFLPADTAALQALITANSTGTAPADLLVLFNGLKDRAKSDLQFRVWHKDGGHNNPSFGGTGYGETTINTNPNVLFQDSPSIIQSYLAEVEHQVEVLGFISTVTQRPQDALNLFNNHLSEQTKNDLRYRVWYNRGGYKDPNFGEPNYGDNAIQANNAGVLFENTPRSIIGNYLLESLVDTNHTKSSQEKVEAFQGPFVKNLNKWIQLAQAAVQTQNNQPANADLQTLLQKRKAEIKPDAFHKSRNITKGNEPVQIDPSQLEFALLPDSVVELRTLAKNLIDAINNVIAAPVGEDTSIEAHRYVQIDTTGPLLNKYDQPIFDQELTNKAAALTNKPVEDAEVKTLVSYALGELVKAGVIYKVEKKVEGGYVIQA